MKLRILLQKIKVFNKSIIIILEIDTLIVKLETIYFTYNKKKPRGYLISIEKYIT